MAPKESGVGAPQSVFRQRHNDVEQCAAYFVVKIFRVDFFLRIFRQSTPDILGEGGPAADYHASPRVTFIDPEIGAVGLTEADAGAAGIDVRVGYVPLTSTTRGFIHGPGNEGFIKVIADRDRGVLVGGTTAGPAGGEMIGALSVAVHASVPVSTLLSTIWAYPTFHRGLGEALKQLL